MTGVYALKDGIHVSQYLVAMGEGGTSFFLGATFFVISIIGLYFCYSLPKSSSTTISLHGFAKSLSCEPHTVSDTLPLLHTRQSRGVAILLSGEPRTVSVTLPGLLRDVIFPLNAEVFVFCSGSNLTACTLLEFALRSSLGEQLRAFDSLESLLERQSQGIIKYTYDSMAVSYLNLHEAWRVRLGKSVKLYQGMQFVMLRFAWELAREQKG